LVLTEHTSAQKRIYIPRIYQVGYNERINNGKICEDSRKGVASIAAVFQQRRFLYIDLDIPILIDVSWQSLHNSAKFTVTPFTPEIR